MGDIFKEQLVKKIPSNKDKIIKSLIIILSIITSIFLLSIPSFRILYRFIALGIIFFAYYRTSFYNIEYEYILTNGELDVDIIYNKSRRKNKNIFILKDVEIMAHINDESHKSKFQQVESTLDYSSGVVTDNTYCFIIKVEGKKTKVLIEPKDDMIKDFERYLNSAKLFLYKV